MKLRNKKTGEIVETDYELSISIPDDENFYGCKTYNQLKGYKSLAELNEEWEDYEEPKEYWWISPVDTDVVHCVEDAKDEMDQYNKEIGNFFETREEAELAVRKLKAWKRLKDKGFRFTLIPGVGSLDITPGKFQIEISAEMPEKWFCCDAVQKDLDDCFGGEE